MRADERSPVSSIHLSIWFRAAARLRRVPLASLLHPGGTVLLVALLIGAVVPCLLASFRWPLIHDAPLMDYIAWRIMSGAVPYRDIFDMNMPGTYVIHIFALRVFGSGDLGWRLFDLGWLVLTAAAIYRFCCPISRWGGALAAAFFFAYHLGQGALSLGQRDFLLCIFLVFGAHLLAVSVEREGRYGLSFLAGGVLGFGATMKPHAAIYAALMLAVLVVCLGRKGRACWLGNTAMFLAGTAVAPAVICLWLAAVGGLHPLFEMVTQYLIPYYPKLGGFSPALLAWQLLKPNLFWIVLVAVPWERSERGPRFALAILGGLYGVLHYGLQERGWWYHEYPFHAFFYILIAMSLAGLLSRPEAKSKVCALLCLLLCEYPLAVANVRAAREPMSGGLAPGKKRVLDSLVSYLGPRVDPRRDTVQTMDTAAGGVNALFVLRVREATRFMYDFHLLNFVNEPFVRQLQTQFMTEIRVSRPKYVVLFKWSCLLRGATSASMPSRSFASGWTIST
ncbi:MAG TPA: hypothetical protein VI455_16360 [Terriglobia bacterium]